MSLSQLQITDIACRCHTANKEYCTALGDFSQVSWNNAPDWQKESAIAGVEGILSGKITNPGDSHVSWYDQKVDAGWTYGEIKDPEARTHPCMVHFSHLPLEQQTKDYIFLSVATHWINELSKEA